MTNHPTPPVCDALLPCPFCGAEAERVDIENGENAGGSCISCTGCQASSNVEFEFKENFVNNWNCRAVHSDDIAVDTFASAMKAKLAKKRTDRLAQCEASLSIYDAGHDSEYWLRNPSKPRESAALSDIAAERRRQIEIEGWTPEHDDRHDTGELARAASCYALSASEEGVAVEDFLYDDNGAPLCPRWWPWDTDWWKPSGDRRDLVKAGALIVAEIERLDRITPAPGAVT